MQNGADRLSEYGGIESSDDGWPLILVILSPCLSPELSPVLPATTGRIVAQPELTRSRSYSLFGSRAPSLPFIWSYQTSVATTRASSV